MIESLCFVGGVLMGVGIYRLGFAAGKTGKNQPMFLSKTHHGNTEEFQKINRLLENIDRYDGTAEGQKPM